MSLSTAIACLRAFYRLVGTTSDDDALTENGEAQDDVAYLALTHGFWAAQRFMVSCGMTERWRTRSQAITSWSGADATDGGRYKAIADWVAADKPFLRLAGKPRMVDYSSLVEANGERWGVEIEPDNEFVRGDYFYLKNEQLWLAKGAAPPGTLYVDYQYRHPEFAADVTIDFPDDARALGVAYAAQYAMAEGWYPRDPLNDARVRENVGLWETEARKVARRSRGPRRQNPPRVIGTRFMA